MGNAIEARVLPNVFIIGAAKAGTSSMGTWLRDHPDICGTTEDETRFLMDANEPLRKPRGYHETGLDGYADFLSDGAEKSRFRLDVSPQYYYQETAKQIISQLAEKHVIFIARKPSARVYSLFNYAKNNIGILPRDLEFADFVDALQNGTRPDLIAHRPMLRDALKHSQYIKFLKEWTERVGQENISVLIFEEITVDPALALSDLERWLGLGNKFYQNYGFPKMNETFKVKSPDLHRMARSVRNILPASMKSLVKPLYFKINTGKPSNQMTERDRIAIADIDELFRPWNEELARYLNRDTEIWKSPST
jgi:hypothetical protein